MTLECKSVGIWDGIVNPIFGCEVEITPDINPMYVGLERSCPTDSKDIECWFRTCVDLFRLDFGLWVVVGWVASVRTKLSLGLNNSFWVKIERAWADDYHDVSPIKHLKSFLWWRTHKLKSEQNHFSNLICKSTSARCLKCSKVLFDQCLIKTELW